jgi:hypothetical protein
MFQFPAAARDKLLRLTEPYVPWVLVALLSGSEADHPPPASAEVKSESSCTSNPICFHGMPKDHSTVTLHQTYFSLMSKNAKGARINGLGVGSDQSKT